MIQLLQKPILSDFLTVCYQLPEDERDQYEAFNGRNYNPEQCALEFAAKSPAWGVYDDQGPLCLAGFDYMRPGVWSDWMLNTPRSFDKEHWRTVTKMAKRLIDALMVKSCHRLQCVSLASRIHAHKWYRVLGLQSEVVLRGYGARGEDAILFSRLRAEDGYTELGS